MVWLIIISSALAYVLGAWLTLVVVEWLRAVDVSNCRVCAQGRYCAYSHTSPYYGDSGLTLASLWPLLAVIGGLREFIYRVANPTKIASNLQKKTSTNPTIF